MPRPPAKRDPASEAFAKGFDLVQHHPIFAPITYRLRVERHEGNRCPPQGWGAISPSGALHVHPKRRASPEEWAHAIAHLCLHLGLGHFRKQAHPIAWQIACDVAAFRFLRDLKIGRVPEELLLDVDGLPRSEEQLYALFLREGIPPGLHACGAAGPNCADMLDVDRLEEKTRREFQAAFASGLTQAVETAVEVAAGRLTSLSSHSKAQSVAERARSWFMSSFPLLGSLAAAFKLVEDVAVCSRMQISIAAVDAEAQEIYVNPTAGLDEDGARMVIAHELLHVGLRHQARRQGRDPYLWNVACDYVINGWLLEMGIGTLPSFGGLYDPALKGLSAEAIYDRIVTDLRRYRKLATFRGYGLGDLIEKSQGEWWNGAAGISLDEFYRRCLTQGLAHHDAQARGLLPAGLVEEIRALDQPAPPWDVELARWFDEHFAPFERRRTYARASRRQSSTPDIPRPAWVPALSAEESRTFGVVLDTSGSMDRKLLAKALGAIASYSLAREVPRARVVFCDAVAYDEGYLAPEAIADRVRVRGRGGTRLQPGIDLLEKAEDFPKEGPILVITDGACDVLRIRREHAFLLPQGCHLPFAPAGPTFRII
jgi:predicted metal-dependent peptidase